MTDDTTSDDDSEFREYSENDDATVLIDGSGFWEARIEGDVVERGRVDQ